MTSADRADALLIADAVLGVGGVVSMSAGPLGQFRSYLPGGNSVAGVRIAPRHVDVNVVGRYGPDLAHLGERIRAAVRPLVGARSIDVGIDDVTLSAPAGPDTAADDAADSTMEAAAHER